MPDAVLRVGEDERHRAEVALDAHYDTCTIWPQEACPVCRELAELAAHAARQLGLLRWKRAVAGENAAKRMRRGRRPVPQVTGIRIPAPKEQP